jgi:serine/threonine-protein kinase RsbW
MQKKTSKLILPNDPLYIGAVISYCDELSRKIGFNDRERGEISTALKEACENVIMHAFEPYEDETYALTFERLEDGLKIVIDEMGLPFTFAMKEKGRDAPGLNAIEANMDRVLFINRGRDGKELLLYKFLKGRHVEEIFTEEELELFEVCEFVPADAKFAVGLMRPEDAIEVSRCIYRAYKYTYLKEDLYFPERIEAMNRDGSMISAVAVTDKGEVVGHFALLPRPNGKVAEIGVAVVVPKCRGRGLMKTLLEYLIKIAEERGFLALYGNAFTMHDLSQKTNLKYGFHETALQLGCFPPGSIRPLTARGLKGSGNVFTFFRYIRKPGEYTVYPPQLHKEMLKEIYEGLGIERSFGHVDAAKRTLFPDESEIHLSIKPLHKTASIELKRYGEDMISRIKAKRLELGDKGFSSIFLDLDLKDPLTPEAAERFEKIGFFFAGLLPDYYGGDALRLQYYLTEVDYGEISTFSGFADKLKGYVKGQDPKWRALHTD